MKALVSIRVSFVASTALAGGWEGSGGEVFRFAKNPWFVKNTASVEYCVSIDKASISADETTIRELIREAIAYWKFELQQQPVLKAGFTSLATQSFNEVASCTNETPLRFLFGYGTLSPEEVAFLVDPRKYIGVSVRTDYDLAEMKGRGFVYISSDRGAKSYDTLPNTGHLLPKAWEKRKLLLYALIHEMGHVFGIPHAGAGVMSEVFLDQLLHNGFYQFYIDHPLQTYITPPLNFEVCSLNGSFNITYFQIPPSTSCVKLIGKLNGMQYEWQVFARKHDDPTGSQIGTIRASPVSAALMGAKPAVLVHLPSEQKVFSLQERFVNTFMIGPIFTEGTAEGIFKTVSSHKPHDIQVELRSDSIVMSGLVSGRMERVLVYRPPSLFNLILGPVGP